MKKIFTLLFLLGITFFVKAQTHLTPQNDDLNNPDVKKSKTANRWDAFGNFIQLTGNDITGDNKGIQFKSILFPLLSWDSVKRNESKIYIKRTWMRNSELQGGVKFAKGNSVNAINLGYNYSILNFRDKSLHDFQFKDEDIAANILENVELLFIDKVPTEKRNSFQNKTLVDYLQSGKIAGADSNLLKAFITILNDSIIAHTELHSKNYFEAIKHNGNIYDSLVEHVSRKPLLTINPSGQYNPIIGKINGAKCTAELIFGIGKCTSKKPWDIDFKCDYIWGDTIANKANLNRQVLIVNLGLNKVLMTESDKKTSLIEFKIGGEIDAITGGRYLDKKEDHYKYFANATLRIRAGKSLWIPLTLKYDTKTSNLFGFLSLNINLDNNTTKEAK